MTVACSPQIETTESLTADSPVTVNIQRRNGGVVEDYRAEVKTYYQNSRIAAPEEEVQSYRLSTKIIDGAIYSRVDFDADESLGIPCRSAISGPDGTVVFATETGEVEHRLPAETAVELENMTGRSLFEKLDIPEIQARMSALGYDTASGSDEEHENLLVVTVPTEILTRSTDFGENISSFELRFDTDMGTMAGSTLQEVLEDGTIVTTEVTKYYQDQDGIPVPVGESMEIHYDIPGTIDIDMDSAVYIEDPDTLPILSDEEWESLSADGGAYELTNPVVGDPRDPDYTETYTTIYETVEVNCLDARIFREVM